MAINFDASSGWGVGSSPADNRRRTESTRLRAQVQAWPASWPGINDQVRAQLSYFKTRRNLGRVTDGEVLRLSERVRDEYEDVAQGMIDSGDFTGWSQRTKQIIESRLRSMAREYVDQLQLIALGGGDRETATLVGIRDTTTTRPPAQTNDESPGLNLARQAWEQFGRRGQIADMYETPVEVVVETDAGPEVLPPIAPCELDAMGFDLPSWYWLTKLMKMGAVG